MRIDSYKANCERRRARHHVATDERLPLAVRSLHSTPPDPSDCISLTTEGADGRTYAVELDRADIARIVRTACESWAQQPAELAQGYVPREREVVTCTITRELSSPGGAIVPVYSVSLGHMEWE